MWKMKKSTALIALVVVVSVFVYYRYAQQVLAPSKEEANTPAAPKKMEDAAAQGWKEVSAEVSYSTPGDSVDHLRFVVSLDKQGVIQQIQTLDAETNEIPEKKQEFNDQINGILKGKKLSELTAIDKVGKSSLTTDAFNQALSKLQSQM